ncbi:expressed unknown protein [Seminavis robusta]|uniref:Uncharacterized protein n=1 Tax=Seminavis robusta TaxID=568900 RepID=A0A9N8H171_9STRA|nr:expressed unknown protein [Seminavis robusta]|eukprot:Sro12_g009210.1 n/a (265) ;mRNA; f:38944-39738
MSSAPSAQSVNTAKANLLRGLAKFRAMGENSPVLKVVANWVGYVNIESKHVRHALKQMKEEGLINRHCSDDRVELTADGIDAAPEVEDVPTTNAEMQAMMLKMILEDQKGLPNAEKTTAVFNRLLDGKVHAKKDLVRAAGFKHPDNRAFRNLVNRMLSFGILENVGKGTVKLTDMAFRKEEGGQPLENGTESNAGAPLSSSSEESTNGGGGTGTGGSSSAGKVLRGSKRRRRSKSEAKRIADCRTGKQRKTLCGGMSSPRCPQH